MAHSAGLRFSTSDTMSSVPHARFADASAETWSRRLRNAATRFELGSALAALNTRARSWGVLVDRRTSGASIAAYSAR